MSKSKKTKTTNKILTDFLDYWDKWHTEWYEKCSIKTPNPNSKIKDWKVPTASIDYSSTKKYKNGAKLKFIKEPFPVYRAIPEPYWIHKDIIANRIELHAVFMNINPGPSKFYHLNSNTKVPNTRKKLLSKYKGEDKNNEIDPEINWFKKYDTSLQTYSKFISSLIDIYGDTVTNENYGEFWHNKNRVDWLKGYSKMNKSTLKNIATFELIPWHTNNVSEIKTDWYNYKSIEDNILNPAIHLSQNTNGLLKNKIISRGKRDKWDEIFNNINQTIIKDKFKDTLVQMNVLEFALARPYSHMVKDYKEWKYSDYGKWRNDKEKKEVKSKRPKIFIDNESTIENYRKSIADGKIDDLEKEIESLKSRVNDQIWHQYKDIITCGFNGPSSLYYTTIWHNRNQGVYFINFSGPQTMELPKLNTKTKVISATKKKTIINFLEKIEDWITP